MSTNINLSTKRKVVTKRRLLLDTRHIPGSQVVANSQSNNRIPQIAMMMAFPQLQRQWLPATLTQTIATNTAAITIPVVNVPPVNTMVLNLPVFRLITPPLNHPATSLNIPHLSHPAISLTMPPSWNLATLLNPTPNLLFLRLSILPLRSLALKLFTPTTRTLVAPVSVIRNPAAREKENILLNLKEQHALQ